MKIFKGSPFGFYIKSDGDCGEESAIRLYLVEECETPVGLSLSPEQAIVLADTLLEVVRDYQNGKETRPRWPELIFDDKDHCN